MTRTNISRRTVLKGVGTVAIGLPLLEEMLASSALAAPQNAIPTRAFNVFFGLGIPAPLQNEGFGGVLEPLKPVLADPQIRSIGLTCPIRRISVPHS